MTADLRIFLTEPPLQPEDVGTLLAPKGIEQKWYQTAIENIPECGWNNELVPLALKAKRAKISKEQFVADVELNTPGGVLPARIREIERAYDNCKFDGQPVKGQIPVATTEKPAPVMLPDPVENETEKFLCALFDPDETIVIAPSVFDAQLQTIFLLSNA